MRIKYRWGACNPLFYERSKPTQPTSLHFLTFSFQKSKWITFLFLAVATLLPSTLMMPLIRWQHCQDCHSYQPEYRQTGIVWISNTWEKCGFKWIMQLLGRVYRHWKWKKRECIAAKTAYTGCVLSSQSSCLIRDKCLSVCLSVFNTLLGLF